MKILSIEPFVPSGADFEQSKKLFQDLGFTVNWEVDAYAGLMSDGCRFILQRYDNTEFAQNFMLSVKVDDVEAFKQTVLNKDLQAKYGIRLGKITQMPYGKEINLIDMAAFAGILYPLIK